MLTLPFWFSMKYINTIFIVALLFVTFSCGGHLYCCHYDVCIKSSLDPWASAPLTQQGGKHWGKERFMENTVGVIGGDFDVIPEQPGPGPGVLRQKQYLSVSDEFQASTNKFG